MVRLTQTIPLTWLILVLPVFAAPILPIYQPLVDPHGGSEFALPASDAQKIPLPRILPRDGVSSWFGSQPSDTHPNIHRLPLKRGNKCGSSMAEGLGCAVDYFFPPGWKRDWVDDWFGPRPTGPWPNIYRGPLEPVPLDS